MYFIIYIIDSNQLKKYTKNNVTIISDEEAKILIQEIRVVLIIRKIKLDVFNETLNKYDAQDAISILELSRMFLRKHIDIPKESALRISRYLIEPRGNSEVLLNESAEKNASQVFDKLLSMIGQYTWTNNEDEEINSVKIAVNYRKLKKIQKNY